MGARKPKYDAVAIALHWIMAIGVLALLAIGFAMTSGLLPKLTMFQLFQLHKSIGVLVLLLAVVRLGWRLTHPAPPLPDSMPAIERKAAGAGHILLYVAIFALPLSGWAYVSASPLKIPTVLFGVLPWPHLGFLADRVDAAPGLKAAHDLGAFVLVVLLVGHVGAAIRHQLKGEKIFQRMSFLAREGEQG